MKSKDEFLKNDIKNCACYHSDDIIYDTDINFSNISLDKDLYESISVYDILYKTSSDPKVLSIRFDKIDGFIINLDGKIRHLALVDYGLFD